jgi:hypothetical protein
LPIAKADSVCETRRWGLERRMLNFMWGYRSGGNKSQLRSRSETDGIRIKSKEEDMFLLSLRTPDRPEKWQKYC